MKKALCLILCALLLLLSACQRTPLPPVFDTQPPTVPPTAPPTGPPVQNIDNPCLQQLQALWDAFPENQKFACAGGDWENFVDGAPGSTNTDPEILCGMLLVPENQTSQVTCAASLLHALNANTFTCGVFQVEKGSAAQFAQGMRNAIQGSQWVCGFPDMLLIANLGNDIVLSAFGKNTLVNTLKDIISQQPNGELLYCEGISP